MLDMFADQTLLILGGSDHRFYLGKLNASEYDIESIWNEFGVYGSTYFTYSLWNKNGIFGSEYSMYSPFNKYASCPPIIADKRGNFYGYFTINKLKMNRAEFSLALIIYEYYRYMRGNTGYWYRKIFN